MCSAHGRGHQSWTQSSSTSCHAQHKCLFGFRYRAAHLHMPRRYFKVIPSTRQQPLLWLQQEILTPGPHPINLEVWHHAEMIEKMLYLNSNFRIQQILCSGLFTNDSNNIWVGVKTWYENLDPILWNMKLHAAAYMKLRRNLY